MYLTFLAIPQLGPSQIDMPKIDLVLPVYNEFESLLFLVSSDDFANQDIFNVIFVNNGSTDFRVKELLSKHEALGTCQVVDSKENLGFGGGVYLGLQKSSSRIVGWYPLNLKVDFIDVSRVARNLTTRGAFLTKALRSERAIIDHLKTFAVGLIHTIISRVNLFDSGGTPTFTNMQKEILAANLPSGYEFELAVLLLAKSDRWRVIRPKVRYGKRKFGVSHWQKGLVSEIRLFRQQLLFLRRKR